VAEAAAAAVAADRPHEFEIIEIRGQNCSVENLAMLAKHRLPVMRKQAHGAYQ